MPPKQGGAQASPLIFTDAELITLYSTCSRAYLTATLREDCDKLYDLLEKLYTQAVVRQHAPFRERG